MTTAQISITVPANDERALVSAATMLLTQAGKLAMPDLDDVSTQTHTSGTDTSGPTAPPEPTARADIPPHVDPGPAEPTMPQPPTSAEAPNIDPSTVETDAAGMPWDSRIHAGTKTKTQDGHWKKRKSVDDATRQAVEAELKNLMAIPSPGVEPEPAAAPTAPPEPAAAAPTAPPEPAAPTAPTAPPEPAAAEQQSDGMDFATFLKEVSNLVQNGHVTMDRVDEIVIGEGLASVSMLSNRPDLIPRIWDQIQGLVGGEQ